MTTSSGQSSTSRSPHHGSLHLPAVAGRKLYAALIFVLSRKPRRRHLLLYADCAHDGDTDYVALSYAAVAWTEAATRVVASVSSLLSVDLGTSFQPDYRLPPQDVYASFCAELLADAENCLPGLLYSAAEQKWYADCDGDALVEGLPSWCLDLRQTFKIPRRATVS